MTETMLERVAEAIRDALPSFVGEPFPDQPKTAASYIDCQEVDFADLARAALEAIREAPLNLCWEAAKMGADRDSDLVQRQFAHIVDSILSQSQEESET